MSQKLLTRIYLVLIGILITVSLGYKFFFENSKSTSAINKSDEKKVERVDLLNIQFSRLPKVEKDNPLLQKKLHLANQLISNKSLFKAQSKSCVDCHSAKFFNGIGVNDLWGSSGDFSDFKKYFSSADGHGGHVAYKNELSEKFLDNYKLDFEQIMNVQVSFKSVLNLLDIYIANQIPESSLFDAYLEGQTDILNTQELQGYTLFLNKGCVSCHHGKGLGGNMRVPKKANLETQLSLKVPSLRVSQLKDVNMHIARNAKIYLKKYLSPKETSEIAIYLKTFKINSKREAINE